MFTVILAALILISSVVVTAIWNIKLSADYKEKLERYQRNKERYDQMGVTDGEPKAAKRLPSRFSPELAWRLCWLS